MVKRQSWKSIIPGREELKKEFLYSVYPWGTIGILHPQIGFYELTIEEAVELKGCLERALNTLSESGQ